MRLASIFYGRVQVVYSWGRYGWTRGGGKTWHGGIDLVGLDDKTIHMPYYKGKKITGKVVRARIVLDHSNKTWEWGYYVCVQLDANQTPDAVNFLYFCHCSSLLVQVGQKVSSGDALAVMGRTGNAALGDCPYDHCHLEVRATATGKGLDPTAYAGCDNAVGIYGTAEDAAPTENGEIVIDVSYHQGVIDWTKVPYRALVRIGYRGYGASGTLVLDPMFEEHFTNVKNAGLKVGVYFFTQAVNEAEAQEEADGCNWALNGRMLDYPIFYDTEASTAPRGTGRADGLGVEDRTKCAIAFCERVKELGYKPGVYASTTWYRKRVDYNTLRSRYTIWNAHYGVSSSPIGCDMWQGTRTAHINGYSGELDANISYIG